MRNSGAPAGRSSSTHGAHDLGDDVAGLVDHDRVPHADVLAGDLVHVVQGRARDRGTGDGHGVKLGHRREHARSAHLHANLSQDGALLLRRELERDGPARGARREAERLLGREGVHLHDHAVDVVVQVIAVREGALAVGVDLGGRGATGGVVVHGEAAVAQPLEEVPLGVDVDRGLIGHGIDEGLQVAMGRDLGILLPETAGGGVSRVGEGRGTGGVGVLVQACEGVARHIDLAADLHGTTETAIRQTREPGRSEGTRDVAHREDVGGHVLPGRAVAARGGAHELGVRVGERHAQAVDLELAGVGDRMLRRGAKGLVRAGEPLVQLGEVHRVVHRVHARGVRHGLELLGHVAAHALGVGLGGDELGVRRLQGEQLLEQAVERGIGHLGIVERIVGVGGVREDAVELRVAGARGLHGLRLRFRECVVAEERHLDLHVLLVCHGSSLPTSRFFSAHHGSAWLVTGAPGNTEGCYLQNARS